MKSRREAEATANFRRTHLELLQRITKLREALLKIPNHDRKIAKARHSYERLQELRLLDDIRTEQYYGWIRKLIETLHGLRTDLLILRREKPLQAMRWILRANDKLEAQLKPFFNPTKRNIILQLQNSGGKHQLIILNSQYKENSRHELPLGFKPIRIRPVGSYSSIGLPIDFKLVHADEFGSAYSVQYLDYDTGKLRRCVAANPANSDKWQQLPNRPEAKDYCREQFLAHFQTLAGL